MFNECVKFCKKRSFDQDNGILFETLELENLIDQTGNVLEVDVFDSHEQGVDRHLSQ